MQIRNRGYSLWLAALGVAVMLFTASCTDKQMTVAAKAAAGVAEGLATVQQENEILCGQVVNKQCTGKLSTEDAKAVADAVTLGTIANDAFVSCVRGVKGSNSEQKQQVLACFSSLNDTLSKVEATALHVKNPEAQATLALSFQSVKTALTAIKALMPN